MAKSVAKLALADGTVFTGRSFGASGETFGEVVFNTSMTGYQEVLTDPSYKGQIVTMTYPLIGNYGTNVEDGESGKPQVEGFIVREMTRVPSNFRSDLSLDSYLAENHVLGIEGLDTRALVRRLRVRGAMTGVLSTTDLDDASLVGKARQQPHDRGPRFDEIGDALQVFQLGKGLEQSVRLARAALGPAKRHRVVAMDFGMKWNILRCLVEMGCDVTVVPGTTGAEDILDLEPDGIFLSNGPGDPEPLGYAHATIRRTGRQEADLRDLPGPSVAGPGAGSEDVQAEVRTSRGKPAGSQSGDQESGNNHPKPRLRGS